MKLLLIRHAESAANAGYLTSNPATIGLTKRGVEEAQLLPDQIFDAPDLIIITEYTRTLQTALPLICKYSSVPIEIWPLHEFTFLSPLTCSNTTVAERLPLVKKYWDLCDPDFVHGAGAESFNQFVERLTDAITKLKNLPHSRVAIFTHGHVIRFVKQYVENGRQAPLTAIAHYRDHMLPYPVANTAILHLEL